MITPQQRRDLQWLWLNGWPVKPAALEIGIPESTAARIIKSAKIHLARDGKPWPHTLPVADRPPLPHKRADPVQMPAPHPTPIPKSQPRRRAPTLEEQLARIAAGARLTRTFKPAKSDHPFTLGGVGSSLL